MSGTRNALLAGVCTSALAFSLVSQASADEYKVSNEAQLRAAVLSANADPDATATIILAGDILMSSTTSLNPPSKPITIDTQGFTLTGNVGSGSGALFLTDSGTSDPVTLEGNFVGGNAAAGSAGNGLITRTGVSAINNGVIVGGNSLDADGGSGVQLGTTGVGPTSFVNNGTIRGGDGPANGVNANGAGIQVRVPTIMPLINNGTVEGGVGERLPLSFGQARHR
jgi:fibronectin-binding autotransporter adhesin